LTISGYFDQIVIEDNKALLLIGLHSLEKTELLPDLVY